MTIEEAVKEYKRRFILIIESVGEVEHIKTFANVEEILNSNDIDGFRLKEYEKEYERRIISKKCPLLCLAALYITAILIKQYGLVEVSSWLDICKNRKFLSIYNKYLKKMTENFELENNLLSVKLENIIIVIKDEEL